MRGRDCLANPVKRLTLSISFRDIERSIQTIEITGENIYFFYS